MTFGASRIASPRFRAPAISMTSDVITSTDAGTFTSGSGSRVAVTTMSSSSASGAGCGLSAAAGSERRAKGNKQKSDKARRWRLDLMARREQKIPFRAERKLTMNYHPSR